MSEKVDKDLERKVEKIIEKKSKNGSVVFLTILLVLVVLLFVGYVLIDQKIIVLGNNETQVDETKEEVEESVKLDVNSVEVKYLHGMTEYSNMISNGINKEVYGSKKLTVSEMSDAYKQNITSSYYAGNVYGQQTLDSTVYVEASAVKAAYDLTFGEGHYKKDLAAKFQCFDLKYDASQDRYTNTWIPCGIAGINYAYEVPLSAVKYDDRIEITVGVVFSYFEDGFYGDFEKTKKLVGNIGGDSNEALKNSYAALVNNNIDSVSQYTYTFKLNKNGFYNYYSVERTKN